jgi:hypothetical protein
MCLTVSSKAYFAGEASDEKVESIKNLHNLGFFPYSEQVFSIQIKMELVMLVTFYQLR